MAVEWPEPKAPDEVADYLLNWTPGLGGETITGSSWSIYPTGSLTKSSSSFTTTTAKVRLSGGTDGITYTLTNIITTSGGQTLEQEVLLICSIAGTLPDAPPVSGTMLVNDILIAAMQEIGALSEGETPTGAELELGIRTLNWMLKSWAAKGANLWRETTGTITFLPNIKTMYLDPYCLDVEEARVIMSPSYERVLQRWERGQYSILPNKSASGYPSSYTITKQTGSVSMTLWPVPTVPTTVLYTFVRVTADVTTGDQSVDIPQEWTEAVYLGLAARLCQTFGITRIDPATAQIVSLRANDLERQLLDADRPASIYMGPLQARYF
jgi:hypothetical protein